MAVQSALHGLALNKGMIMALSPGDLAECKEIARVIVKEVLETHVQTCPYGRSLLKFTCIAAGIAIGSGIAGGGFVLTIIKVFGG